jgi:hypothetical protein
MFKYSDTRKTSKANEAQLKVVTKQRAVTYIHDSGLITNGLETVEEKVIDPQNFNSVVVQVVESKTVHVTAPVKRKKKKDEEMLEDENVQS